MHPKEDTLYNNENYENILMIMVEREKIRLQNSVSRIVTFFKDNLSPGLTV